MADSEPFTLVEETARPGPHHLFDNVVDLSSAKTADHDLQYIAALREANPGTIVTAIPAYNVPLRAFAASGFATCELDRETDSFASWRGYVPPGFRGGQGQLGESVLFAKYHYQWKGEDFILYTVGSMQYVLKECRKGEHPLGSSRPVDELIQVIGDWLGSDQDVVWVYDRYWTRSKALWDQVQKASWDKVILDEGQKKDLTGVANKFFSSKEVYEDLGVPWKRGLLFHGPPGNGKTISIKALMHTLLDRKDTIPTLYVKSAPTTYDIRNVFSRARMLSPCMLVLEDVETIVTPQTRSYFFNEMDGLENNDGLFVVASTNFLDRLDPGLSKRPSRFDRKYLFPLPNEHERTLYCKFWRHKLENRPKIEFPEMLCPAMAHITSDFSFAFLQECFVATLLVLARDEDRELDDCYLYENSSPPKLDDFALWLVFKQQAAILRKEVNSQRYETSQSTWNHDGSNDMALPVPEPSESAPLSILAERTTRQSSIPDLSHLHMREKVLPELPYQFSKRAYINTAAYEYKLRYSQVKRWEVVGE